MSRAGGAPRPGPLYLPGGTGTASRGSSQAGWAEGVRRSPFIPLNSAHEPVGREELKPKSKVSAHPAPFPQSYAPAPVLQKGLVSASFRGSERRNFEATNPQQI